MNFFVRAVVIACVVMQGFVFLPALAQDATSPTAAPTRSSNTQGTAGSRATRAVTAASDTCSFPGPGGVHDPFCGKSISEIIGRVVQFLLGVAGALFLAMFVYGGAVWLTAGSSDRHEQAKKTLLNAAAGVLIVIGSYTMIALLIRFTQGLGVSQGNVAPVQEAAPATDQTAPPAPHLTEDTFGATVSCHDGPFTDACSSACPASGSAHDACVSLCGYIDGIACSGMGTLEVCQSNCSDACATTFRLIDPGPGGTASRSAFIGLGCNAACPSWCRAGFPVTTLPVRHGSGL